MDLLLIFIQKVLYLYITLTLLHSERPKLYAILTFLSSIGLKLDVFGVSDYSIYIKKLLYITENHAFSFSGYKLFSTCDNSSTKDSDCIFSQISPKGDNAAF